MVRIIPGDCRLILPTLPAKSVQCVVTSPPYFCLRDYGVDGQIGLEPSPQEYVEQLVAVFREVRRVLRKDGTAWLNLGDGYAGSWGNQGRKETRGTQRPINGGMLTPVHDGRYPSTGSNTGKCPAGLKPKDLLMIPARVALALQADGWWLRSEIIWSKAAPMPESVRDRPTCAHEKVWLLTRSERYFYDADAVAEPASNGERFHGAYAHGGAAERTSADNGRSRADNTTATRNLRNVWHLNPEPFPGAHFATMPPTLAERCIKAGSRPGDTVLDPFAGAGTTGLVADRLGRDAVLIDLNASYGEMSRDRITSDAPLFAQVSTSKQA